MPSSTKIFAKLTDDGDSFKTSHPKSSKKPKPQTVQLSESDSGESSHSSNPEKLTTNSKTQQNTLAKFLEIRPQFEISKSSNTDWAANDFDSDEDELWIVQCPRSIEINTLLKSRLTLPTEGKLTEIDCDFSTKDGSKHLECHSELLNHEKYLTLISQTGGSPKAVSVKQTGLISIRERIDLPNQTTTEITTSSNSETVEYPRNLRIRHPLFGTDYEDAIVKQESIEDSSKKRKKVKKERHSDDTEIKKEILNSPKKPKRKSENLQLFEDTSDAIAIKQESNKFKKEKQGREHKFLEEVKVKTETEPKAKKLKRNHSGEIKTEILSQAEPDSQPSKKRKRKRSTD